MSIPLNLSPMSELDAVNMMLLSIGQAPVNTLEVPGIKDVSFARLMLHNTNRQVQSRGWWFNRELGYELVPASNREIVLPGTVLEVVSSDPGRDLIERDRKLYDRDRHTFKFDDPVKVDVVWFLPFEDIPQVARDFVAMRAARIFQSQIVGSQILYQFTKEMELEAGALMTQQDMRAKRPNMLTAQTRHNARFSRRR